MFWTTPVLRKLQVLQRRALSHQGVESQLKVPGYTVHVWCSFCCAFRQVLGIQVPECRVGELFANPLFGCCGSLCILRNSARCSRKQAFRTFSFHLTHVRARIVSGRQWLFYKVSTLLARGSYTCTLSVLGAGKTICR